MNEIYNEIDWICPKCNYKNKDTYLDIETSNLGSLFMF